MQKWGNQIFFHKFCFFFFFFKVVTATRTWKLSTDNGENDIEDWRKVLEKMTGPVYSSSLSTGASSSPNNNLSSLKEKDDQTFFNEEWSQLLKTIRGGGGGREEEDAKAAKPRSSSGSSLSSGRPTSSNISSVVLTDSDKKNLVKEYKSKNLQRSHSFSQLLDLLREISSDSVRVDIVRLLASSIQFSPKDIRKLLELVKSDEDKIDASISPLPPIQLPSFPFLPSVCSNNI